MKAADLINELFEQDVKHPCILLGPDGEYEIGEVYERHGTIIIELGQKLV